MITIIAAKSTNNVIGYKNDLPWHLPADLKHFRKLTTNQTVVMGRKTYDSIIKRLAKPLPNRTNVVLTRDQNFQANGVETIHDIDDLMDYEDVFIIGGEQIYRQTLALADRLIITEVQASVEGDSYFPEINLSHWREVSRDKHKADEKNQYDYDFVVYERA